MNYKHGKTDTPTYCCWRNMLNRCRNPKVKSFRDYGEKGITVCERWRDFRNFLADMGEQPRGLTIDRIDNTKGYSKGNCRWATRLEQAKNKSDVHNITFNGKTQHLRAWARELGVKYHTLYMRLHTYGWTPERTFTSAPH